MPRVFRGFVAIAIAASVIALVSLAAADDTPKGVVLSVTLESLPDPTGIEVVDRVGDTTLRAKLDSMVPKFWLESKNGISETIHGWSPVLAGDGSVIYVDSEDLSLKQLLTTGEEKELLGPGSAGGFLRISTDRRFIGYAVPIDLPPGSNWIGIWGAEIMSLETGQVIASRTRENFFTSPIGWHGDNLIVSEWDSTRPQNSLSLYTFGTDGKFSVFATHLPGSTTYPVVSPDQEWMAYEDRDGNTVLVSLIDASFGIIPDVLSPSWSNQGLTGMVDGQRVLVRVASEHFNDAGGLRN